MQLYNHEGNAAERLRREREMSVPMRGGADTSLEYTPDYIYHPAAANRLHTTFGQLDPQLLEHVRFIVMLREPVARAVSSYWSKGGSSAADAMLLFDRLILEFRRQEVCLMHNASAMTCGSDGNGGAWTSHDHISKSVYAPQFDRWFRFFTPCQFYVTTMERFYMRGPDERDAAYLAMLAWAGLPSGLIRSDRDIVLGMRMNPTTNPLRQPLPTAYQQKLHSFFEPHNLRLTTLLGSRHILRDWGVE